MKGYYTKQQNKCYYEELYDGSEEVYCYYLSYPSYRLKLKWIKPGTTKEDSIPFYQVKIPYNPVSFLLFESDYYTVPINAYFEIPFKFGKGKATECIGVESLTIDLDNHLLKGIIQTEQEMKLNIYCKTSTSTTNTVSLTIGAINKYVKGIVGYYLKSDNFDSSCSIPYTPSTENVNVEIIRLEDGINHEYVDKVNIWDGLTPNFAGEFGVEWEGYLKIEVNNSYTFNLTSVYGSWLYIDYVEIINHKGIHEWSSKTKTIELTVGYHFIRVNYMKNLGESGIELKMREGELDEFKELNEKLFFIPRGDFEYTTSYAVYIKDKPIDINYPRIYDGSTLSECISDPTLPSGLEITSDCIIHGKPKSVSEKHSYTIIGKVNNEKMINSTIQIRIIESVTPSGIHIIDLDNIGVKYNETLNLYIGNESHLSIEVENGYVLYYEIENSPGGFELDELTGSLTVVGREMFTNYELIIKAYYDGSETPISKVILVNVTNGCLEENEENVFFKLDNDINPRKKEFDYEFRKSNGISLSKRLEIPAGPVPVYSQSICLIPGDYILYISDMYPVNTFGSNYLTIYSNGKLVDYLTIKNGGYGSFKYNTVLKGPTLEYGKIKTEYYVNDVIELIPQVNMVEICEISPELPSCLSFNTSSCRITGKVNQTVPNTKYTITAHGRYMNTIRHITLALYNDTMDSACRTQNKALVSINLYVEDGYIYPDDWKYYLYRTSDVDFDNRTEIVELDGLNEKWEKNKEYMYDFCLEEDLYTSVFEIDDYTFKDMKKSYFDISVNDIAVTRIVKEGSYNFNSITDYNFSTEWEYSSQYEKGWDDINKASGLWDKDQLSNIENKSGYVMYIRKMDSFKELDKYNAFALKVSYISGIKIKMNGKEIFRNNLPEGEISPSTKANNRFDELRGEVFLLPLDWLEEDRTIITIELHKHENENKFPQINCLLLKILGNKEECLILNKYTNPISETNTTGNPGFEIRYGFDENSNTNSYSTLGWSIMRFKNGFHSYFNQFSIHIEEIENYPEDLSIEGYDNNNEWNKITQYEGITFPSDLKRVFTNYNMSKIYSALRVNITKKNSDDETMKRFGIIDFNFHLCPFRYCKSIDGLPETPTGTEIIIGCKNPSFPGERTFYCGNDKKWEEKNSTCDEEPSVVFQENEYSFKAGNNYKDVSLFKVSGNNISYSMNPKILGLELDERSGLISGRPYKEENEKIIKFEFVNHVSINPIIIEIKITILASEKPILIWLNDSIILEAGTEYKDLRLFYVTGLNITYKVEDLPSGLYIDNESGLINGMSLEESSNRCRIKAKNKYEIDFIIIINITLPMKPKNIKYEEELIVIFGKNYSSLHPYECIAKTILYSIEPELPEGLELNEKSGIISGKVKIEPPNNKSYIIKCYNEVGNISNPITIYIEESIEPIIINHIDNITIEGGKEYEKVELGRVSGKNLLYKISPYLPSETLKLDKSSGILSGYISEKFEEIELTMTISGSGKQVSYSFIMNCLIHDYPVIVNSTKISNITFDFNKPIKSVYLFTVVGTNIHISVKPKLPEGLTLISETGEIYGSVLKYVEETKYTFTIENPPSPIIERVEVMIKFEAVYCESDSGFPKTVAEKGGKEVSIKCGGGKNGMKRRNCLLTDENKAIWSIIDDSECEMSNGVIAGIAVGSVAVGLIIIIIIMFFLLRTGMFRRRARSTSTVRSHTLHKIIVDVPENEKVEGEKEEVTEGVRV